MLDFLGALLTPVRAFGQLVLWGLVSFANLLIEAIGTAIGAFMSLLPSMPAPPSVPVADWLGWLNWLFPIGPMVAALAVFVAVWIAFLLIRIPLKWVKAL
jgi:hypothetical protein